MPHPMLSMKLYESFWKYKFDPYLYSLKFVSDFDTNYVSYLLGLRVGSLFWATLYVKLRDRP